jgi:hypothetical protein
MAQKLSVHTRKRYISHVGFAQIRGIGHVGARKRAAGASWQEHCIHHDLATIWRNVSSTRFCIDVSRAEMGGLR